MCNKKDFMWQLAMTSSVSGLRRRSKLLQTYTQRRTCTKIKRSWSLCSGLLPVWSTIASWILVKTLHQRSMLSKQMRCTENYNACSWHWSTERARFSSDNAQPHVIQPALQKLNELGYEVLPHLPCSPDLSPTDYHQASWQLWAWKMLPQPAGGRKCFLRVHRIPKYGFLCYRNKQTYFSWAKMCWL